MNTPLVRDHMNPHLVYIREGDRAGLALKPILEFGITAVPVVDDDHKPVGVVSLRDLVDPKRQGKRMSEPVLSIRVEASIHAAASAMADANVHHLVVIDSNGHVAGMISSLDVVRALIGLEAKHPSAIETFERPTPENC
jgi:CBS domain-containing protein